MRRFALVMVLAAWVVFLSIASGCAQNKTARQLLSKADAESNLGEPVVARGGNGGSVHLGTPKSNAVVAASPAAEAAATAKLLAPGKTFSQAPYITKTQFFEAIKEVSLSFDPDSTLAQYISPDQQRDYIVKALAQYGIAIRANRSVTLVVTIDHKQSLFTETLTRGGATTDETKTIVHSLVVSLEFTVRAAALRNGKLHLVVAAPASDSELEDVPEDPKLSQLVLGGTPQKKIKEAIADALARCLKSIASPLVEEPPPWPVSALTEKERAVLDGNFTGIMRPQTAVEKRPFEGLDSKPEISLEHNFANDRCILDPSWQNSWDKAFRRLGWVQTPPGQPHLLLSHFFYCGYRNDGLVGHAKYFTLLDNIVLYERNLVFELNGGLVRRRGDLLNSYRLTHSVDSEIESKLDGFLQRGVTAFLTDVVLGDR